MTDKITEEAVGRLVPTAFGPDSDKVGPWVHFDDYAALAAERDALREALEARPSPSVQEAARVLEQSQDARKAAFDEMWNVAINQYSLEATNSGGARYSITGDVINALWYAALRALSNGETDEG